MYVTNLTPTRLGISGPIVLSPYEKNRYLDEKNVKIMASVMRLKAGNFVTYTLDAGLTKTAPVVSVKTLAVDVSAIGNKPKVIRAPEAEKEAEDAAKNTNTKEVKDALEAKIESKEETSSVDKKPRKSKKAQ